MGEGYTDPTPACKVLMWLGEESVLDQGIGGPSRRGCGGGSLSILHLALCLQVEHITHKVASLGAPPKPVSGIRT